MILTGVMHLLADTLRMSGIDYRAQVCLRLCGVTKFIGLTNVEITFAISGRSTVLTLAVSTNLPTNES